MYPAGMNRRTPRLGERSWRKPRDGGSDRRLQRAFQHNGSAAEEESMSILSMREPDGAALALFSEQDDFMQDFLGEDRRYYTRYGTHEHLEKIWVIYDGDSPAGCIAFRQKAEGLGEVKRLFVRAQHRGKGLSKPLLAAVEARARERGCRTLFLDTRITLEPAVSIYRRAGFHIVFQQGLDIQMEKTLSAEDK